MFTASRGIFSFILNLCDKIGAESALNLHKAELPYFFDFVSCDFREKIFKIKFFLMSTKTTKTKQNFKTIVVKSSLNLD